MQPLPTIADYLRRAIWVGLAVMAVAAILLLLTPVPTPPVYERREITPTPTITPAPRPTLFVFPAAPATVAKTPDSERRRIVNLAAPYCCANWTAWVNSIEITADGLLRLDVSLHNNSAWDGVSFAADPMLLDENGRSYPLRRDLAITFGAEHPVPPGGSVSGALFFTAPPPEVQWVDFLYTGGYQWIRRIELP